VSDAVPETIEASLRLSEAVLVDMGIPMGKVIASIHEKRDEFRKILQSIAGRADRTGNLLSRAGNLLRLAGNCPPGSVLHRGCRHGLILSCSTFRRFCRGFSPMPGRERGCFTANPRPGDHI
jgi:hypothetical protein